MGINRNAVRPKVPDGAQRLTTVPLQVRPGPCFMETGGTECERNPVFPARAAVVASQRYSQPVQKTGFLIYSSSRGTDSTMMRKVTLSVLPPP